MKMQRKLLLVLLVLSPTTLPAKPAYHHHEARCIADWQSFCKKYFPPMMVSSLVGMGTGGFLRYIEKELKLDVNESPELALWVFAAWFAEYSVRNAFVESIQKDFDDCNIPYKKNLMSISAWIASWMTYLHV